MPHTMTTDPDLLKSLHAAIRPREEQRERIHDQLAEARTAHAARRRELVTGACSVDDAVAAEARVNMLQSTLSELDGELSGLREQVRSIEEAAQQRADQLAAAEQYEVAVQDALSALADLQAYVRKVQPGVSERLQRLTAAARAPSAWTCTSSSRRRAASRSVGCRVSAAYAPPSNPARVRSAWRACSSTEETTMTTATEKALEQRDVDLLVTIDAVRELWTGGEGVLQCAALIAAGLVQASAVQMQPGGPFDRYRIELTDDGAAELARYTRE